MAAVQRFPTGEEIKIKEEHKQPFPSEGEIKIKIKEENKYPMAGQIEADEEYKQRFPMTSKIKANEEYKQCVPMTGQIKAEEYKQHFPMTAEIKADEEYTSIDIGENNMTMERCPVARANNLKNLCQWVLRAVKAKLKLNSTTYGKSPPRTNEHVSGMPPSSSDDHTSITVSNRGIYELLVEMVAPQLASGFQVTNTTTNNHSAVQQGGSDPEVPDDDLSNMPGVVSRTNLAVALWVIALLTMSMVIATTLYKPARGVVFGHNKEAYYLTLGVIFASGVAEAFTAYWVSRSHDANRRRFSFGRAILLASVVPFVAIVGIDGFAFIEG